MIYLYGAGKRNSIVIDLLQQNKIKQKIVLIDKKKLSIRKFLTRNI